MVDIDTNKAFVEATKVYNERKRASRKNAGEVPIKIYKNCYAVNPRATKVCTLCDRSFK